MKPPSAIWRTVLFPPCFLDRARVDPLRRVVRALRWGMPTQAVDECRRVGSSPGRFSCWSPLTRGHFEVSTVCRVCHQRALWEIVREHRERVQRRLLHVACTEANLGIAVGEGTGIDEESSFMFRTTLMCRASHVGSWSVA